MAVACAGANTVIVRAERVVAAPLGAARAFAQSTI
jgi:hypothetical protein